ncbi:MAG: DNA double-strand break repair nuclease NurA [Chloroflexota bacterium]
MTLDLAALSVQIERFRHALSERDVLEEERLRRALALLGEGSDPESIRAKVERARTPWRAAVPLEPLTSRGSASPLPAEFSALASDGSTNEPDRHGSVMCYLINIGLVALHYGHRPDALLHSEPFLGYKDEDLYISAGQWHIPVSSAMLAIRRQIMETERLAALASSLPKGRAAVALQDGTLTIGGLEGPGLEKWVHDNFLPPLLGHYERFREQGVPLASYISRPRHQEVVNTLRIIACPEARSNCVNGCPSPADTKSGGAHLCHLIANLTDRFLLRAILEPGERSGVFQSLSPISREYFGDHRVHFFYVHVGSELARVEVPEWVARSQAMLTLVHSAVIDQCERGRGYPTVLMEAHEQAVLRVGDRRQLEQMLDAALVRAGLPVSTSEKERGKRLRAL